MKSLWLSLWGLWVTLAASAADAGAPVLRAVIDGTAANASFECRWDPARGLRLQVETVDAARRITLDLKPAGGRLVLEPEKGWPASLGTGLEQAPEGWPVTPVPRLELTLKVRPEFWALYAGPRLVCQLPSPFAPPLRILQPAADLPAGDVPEAYVQKVADFTFHDDFLVPEDDDNPLAAWETLTGTWQLHTAADSALEHQVTVANLAAAMEAVRSPNFYSLKGTGRRALLATGYAFYDLYHLEAAVQSGAGEGGLAFHVQDDGSCYGFTLRGEPNGVHSRLALWRQGPGDEPKVDLLAAARAPVAAGDWVRLRVRVLPRGVQCFLDGAPVFDLPLDLPPGGRLGLFADADKGLRFDDVDAATCHDLDFTAAGGPLRYALHEQGDFSGGGLRAWFGSRPPHGTLAPGFSWKEQELVLGAVSHAPHVFAADFTPADAAGVGLLAGWRAADQPYYRFVRELGKGGAEHFRLERVVGGRAATLEELALPAGGRAAAADKVRLMCDATGPEFRCYRDGQLVLVHQPADAIGGASGLFLAPRSRARIDHLTYTFSRPELEYRSRLEKNRIFVEDPFMRHWSSPEGEWVDDRAGHVWYKGDFYGRFLVRLPFVPHAQVHLGVSEGKTEGAVVLRLTPTELLVTPTPAGGAPAPAAPVRVEASRLVGMDLPDAEVLAPDGTPQPVAKPAKWFEIQYEGHWVWIVSGGKTLAKLPLAEPLRGRRLRIQGFTTEQLMYSYVERYQLKDFLFTESLADWVQNGGTWEVVNRFQCQPRWSHLNGESADGLAALWAKYRFAGDFCVEMYVGTRHGQWYQRPGDFNLTILNRDTTASEGYSVTCSGWDPDQSQLWTRLFRNGTVVARSDKYTAPRVREGSVRKGYNPLVHAGRDVHGAWYYIKFRRVGTRLEYWFDNELVLATEDRDPLRDGSFGIWTYMNSMMVARVKIAAEQVAPLARPVTPLPLAAAPAPGAPPPRPPLLKDNLPMGAMEPGLWGVTDPVGLAQLSWHDQPGHGPYFVVTQAKGAGQMFARCALPPVPCETLAGWRFYLKRTPRARLNAHFSIGRVDGAGVYTPARHFFHRITGSDFAKGTYAAAGATEVAAAAGTAPDWHRQGGWTTVEVWLPPEAMEYTADRTWLARFEGLGDLQPGDVVQGLTGNGPGEAYAVRDLAEIRYVPPTIRLGEAAPPVSFTVLDERSGRELFSGQGLDGLTRWLSGAPWSGMLRAVLETRAAGRTTRHQLGWIRLPQALELGCNWDPQTADSVALTVTADYPDRRFFAAQVAVAGRAVPLTAQSLQRRVGVLPRIPEIAADRLSELPVTVQAGGQAREFKLAWSARAGGEGPLLLRLDGLAPLLQTFEQEGAGPQPTGGPARLTVIDADPQQGRFLRVANPGSPARLIANFPAGFDLARYPVLAFRYRGQPMSRVSLGLGLRQGCFVRFTEEFPSAVAVRPALAPTLDERWHSWVGIVSDATLSAPFASTLFACSDLRFGSFHGADQTGLFSELDLDDLVAGPAVARREQLAVTPEYRDLDGVQEVRYALRAGPEPYAQLTPEARTALAWRSVKPGTRIEPELDGLAQGLAHLFLAATDTRGNPSAVTSIPFLVDQAAPDVSVAHGLSGDPRSNGPELHVYCNTGGGAPMDLSALTVKWDGTPVPVPAVGSTLAHSANADVLVLNWPFIFQRQVQAAASGQTHTVTLANLRDGAGNAVADREVPVTLDFAADKRPPTLLRTQYPANVLWATNWESPFAGQAHGFTVGGGSATLVRDGAEPPYLRLETARGNALDVVRSFGGAWVPETYPYLAFRIRRPVIPGNDKAVIRLVFQTNVGPQQLVSLVPGRGEEGALPLAPAIPWRANAWHEVGIDVRPLLRAALTLQESNRRGGADKLNDAQKKEVATQVDAWFKNLRIHALRVTVEDAPPRSALDIGTLFVFGPWRPQDRIEFRAYDASGIGGLAWRGAADRTAAEPALLPAALPPEDRALRWLEVRVRDRAGNLATPIAVPLLDTGGRADAPPAGAPQPVTDVEG